jgi:maleylpyruvate isomerase
MAPDPGRPEQALEWMRDGTRRLLADLERLPDSALDAPTALPGWNRRFLLSHVAANAAALRNLVHWARTGQERRMYASRQERDEGIAAGAARPAGELRELVAASAAALERDLDTLPDSAWGATVITAQGLTRPAGDIPWMRAREACVHAVDLDAGTGFADLPAAFLIALCDDIARRRSVTGNGPALTLADTGTGRRWEVTGAGGAGRLEVTAPAADLAAWLAGRPAAGLADTAGRAVPDLPPWL